MEGDSFEARQALKSSKTKMPRNVLEALSFVLPSYTILIKLYNRTVSAELYILYNKSNYVLCFFAC